MELQTPEFWLLAMTITLFGGFIKGIVGFAMPMIMISGLASIAPPEVALAGLILPACVGNLWQALRQGPGVAWRGIRRYRVFLVTGGVVMMLSAQLVPMLPDRVLLLIIGGPITLYALLSLSGRALRLPAEPGGRVELGFGALTGAIGGMTGVWGPTTVAMLNAQDIDKTEQLQIQGVVYGLGALLLLGSHLGSGVLNRETLPLSVALVLPGLLGMWLGFKVHKRIAQTSFRRLTLAVLLIAGLNLVRRALMVG